TVTLSGLSLINGNGFFNNYYDSFINWGAGGNHTTTTGTAQDGQGGAIWNGGTLTVNGCTLADNTADLTYGVHGVVGYLGLGGAIYNAGTLTVSNNSTLAYNSAGDRLHVLNGYCGNGGGIYNGGTLTVSGSTLAYNTAFGSGSYYSGGLGGAIDNAGT